MATLKRDDNERDQDMLPKIKTKIVSCPLMSKFDTVVESNFCINKCPHFSKYIPSSSQEDAGHIECNFPRRIKIYPVAGD